MPSPDSAPELDAPSRGAAGRLLGVWAHPDDEIYLSAGLMCLTRRTGGEVVVATATRGEHGAADGDPTPDELSATRAAEQRRALAEIDVVDSRWLGYADGSLADVDAACAIDLVADLIDAVDPSLIVTFGPDGMTGHPDHQAVSRWTTAAWRRTGRRAPLWYATLSEEWHERWDPLNRSVGLWFDGATPPRTGSSELALRLRCRGELMQRKHLALRAHASQTRALEDLVGSETYREWWAEESFVHAPVGGPAEP